MQINWLVSFYSMRPHQPKCTTEQTILVHPLPTSYRNKKFNNKKKTENSILLFYYRLT